MENFNLIGKQVGAPEINLTGQFTGYADGKTLEPPTEGGYLEGLGEDLAFAITNPSAVAAKMRAGAEYALAGIQKMRADELERVGNAGIYGSEYAAEVRKSSEDLASGAKALSSGIAETYKPKSKVGQFASDLTQSVPAALSGVGTSIVAGPVAGVMVGTSLGGAQVFGSKYLERRDMNDTPDEATKAASIHALAEMGSEALGASAFVKLFRLAKAGKPIGMATAREAFTEGAEEVMSGLIQGSEDAFRGAGATPDGWQGALEYFTSGEFLKDAAENFAGGFVMGGALHGGIATPIMLSYKPKALEAVKQMDSVIRDAETKQVSSVDVAGQSIPLDELRQRMDETIEAFGIQPAEWAQPSSEVIEQDQAKFNTAVAALQDMIKPPAVETPTEAAVEPTQDVQNIQDVESPQIERAIYSSGSVKAFGQVHSGFADTLNEIYTGLNWQPAVELYNKADLTETDLETLNRSAEQIATIGSARVMTYKDSDGKSIYRIVGNLSNAKKPWTLSTVMHEALGHIVDYEFWSSAPDAIKQTVDARFESWLKAQSPETFFSPDIVEQVADPNNALTQATAGKRNETGEAYKARMFREFKAHQISAAMQKRPEVRSVIERHWARLYEKLKALYKSFQDNYLDIVSNVGTMDEFVNWLYLSRAPQASALEQTVEGSNQVNVEKFNTKLNPFVEAVYNSLFDMANGKRVIKDIWKVKRIFQNGTSGKVTRGDMQRTGYRYKEDFANKKTLVLHGKDQILFTIPWDHSRGLSKDSARMVAVNIRDLLVVTSLGAITKNKPKRNDAAYRSLQRVIGERAKQLAADEGISEKQAYINIMSGYGSIFSKLTPGIKGTPDLTLNQSNRTLKPLMRDIERFQTAYPGLFQQLYGDFQDLQNNEAGLQSNPFEEVIKDEHAATPAEKVNSVVRDIQDQVASIAGEWYNKARPSERVREFDKLSEKVIFYFNYQGRDYTEVSPEIRNLVSQSLRDVWQDLSGVEIQADIQNKSLAIDKVMELRQAGADFTLEEIELMRIAQDMGMLDDDFIVLLRDAESNGLEIFGSYKDPADGRVKAVLANNDTGWLLSEGDPTPGSGELPQAWLSKGYALTLGDVWQAPALYEIYPGLRNLSVRFYIDPNSDVAGRSSWSEGYIEINYNSGKASTIDTLVHEIQHQIQGIEDFPGGSNPDMMKRAKDEKWQMTLEAQELVRAATDIKKDIEKGGEDYAFKKVSRLRGRQSDLAESVLLRMRGKGIDATLVELKSEMATIQKEFDSLKLMSPDKLYRRTAGEDEARRAALIFRYANSGKDTKHDIRTMLQKDGVIAFSNLEPGTKKIVTDARSGKVNLSVISTTEETASDEMLFASYAALQSDDLILKPRVAKKVRVKTRPDRADGIYAQILKVPVAPRKLRKAKVLTVEQVEKRQQANAQFITMMNTVKDQAEKRQQSMSEVLLAAGFDSKQVRRAISKFNRLQSKFSQNEMIIRLSEVAGLINEDTGREGLESLLKVIFPATEEEPGSDGTLQGLTPIAKDIVINRLQNIILANRGSRYDIESEQSLAQLGETFKDEYNRKPGWAKTLSFVKWFQSSAADFLLSTEAGRKLHFKLRQVLLEKAVMQRDYLVQLNKFGRDNATDEQRDRLYKLVTGELAAVTLEDRHFVSLIHKINVVFGKEMESLGVKIYKKDGTFKYFKYDKDTSIDYFPHMWKPEWFSNPTDAMIQSLLDSKEASNVAHAKRLIQLKGKERIRMSKFANIEMERETDLGGWITDPIEVYTKYIQSSSVRLAALKVFGETPELTLAQLAIKHFKDSRDADAFAKARDLINRVLGNKVDDALLREPKSAMSTGVLLSVGLLLQHSMLVQPGVVANMGAMAGYKNLVKGIAKVLPSLWGNKDGLNNKRWAELAGVLAFTVNRELNDIIQDEQTRKTTDATLRSFGITQMDSFLRIIGAIVGKLYATDVALRYIERGTLRDAKRLEALGINPAKLSPEYVQSPEWFAHDLRMAALAFTEDTNFVIDPMRAPAFVQGHPLLKVFMLFKNFAFQQHRLLMKLIRDKEFGKFIAAMLGSLAFGALINLFKTLVKGDDPRKVLERDGLATTMWRGFMAGGGPGIFTETFGAAAYGGGISGHGLSAGSPMFGLIEQGLKGAGSLYDVATGQAEQNDLNQLYRTGAMAMQSLLLIKAPMQYGVPLNAVIGMSRPAAERLLAPADRQEGVRLID